MTCHAIIQSCFTFYVLEAAAEVLVSELGFNSGEPSLGSVVCPPLLATAFLLVLVISAKTTHANDDN